MKHGALHDPAHPSLIEAVDYASVRVGAALPAIDWFNAWNWEADGDVLGNDELSCCCEVADLRLIQGWLAAEGKVWTGFRDLVELRYEAVAGWDGIVPGNDPGTIPAADCFAWQTAPIAAAGELWRVRWCTVPVDQTSAALRRGPLQLTLALWPADADDPDRWRFASTNSAPPSDFHRVVCGAQQAGLLICRTYGFDVPVHPSRVVAADLMIHVDAPVSLRSAGLIWS